MEERRGGPEDLQHHEKGQEIVDGTDRANEHHEVPYKADVPALRLLDEARVNVVGWDGHLRQVVEKVVEQDLRRQHRQKR